MTEEMAMKPGDYIVIYSWKYAVEGPLSSVTAQQVRYGSKSIRHEYRTRKDAVLFAGTEAECTSIAEKLNSSLVLMEQERKAAAERHKARTEKLLKGGSR